MELIKLTHENIETEHICCAISNHKDIQVMAKKSWLKERLEEGLTFLKCNVRGKCFIEYVPAERAWAPIEAKGYVYINCLWVAGQFKGKGYSNLLLETCIADSKEKGRKGIVALSSEKKRGFLSDARYLQYKGFQVADTADPYFQLLYLPFDTAAEKPHFKPQAKEGKQKAAREGFTLYYTYQCPFTAKYVPLLEDLSQKRKVAFQAIRLLTREQAQDAPTPFTTYSLFYNGAFITHEILSEKKFEKILAEKSL